MSLYQNDIQGNANISRNANIGSHAAIGGDLEVGHNVCVKGWLDAPNIKGPLKGLYASEAALNEAYPLPQPGWFALVGNSLPAAVYRTDGENWVATGENGGQFSVYLDTLEKDVKDVTDDVKDIEEMLADGILISESIAFTSTGSAASMTFNVLKRDGTVTPKSKTIPIVTAEDAGMMSAADKQELSAATAAIEVINGKIATLEATTVKLREDLNKEISDREAADTTLSGRIADEITNRKKADEDIGADILELQNTVYPLELDFTATPTIIKAGEQTSIRLTWEVRRRGKDVTAEAELTLGGTATTGKAQDEAVNLAHGAAHQFTLKATFEGLTETATRSVRGTHPSYFGAVSKTWEVSEDDIKALNELIIGNRALTRAGISTNDGRIALAYPKDFGALTSVKDGNGYEVLSSYTRSEHIVNGIEYYLYLLTVPVTASGVTQIYK